MPLRIANAAGFLGDQIEAARALVERAELDTLTLEYLAELTLSILARQRQKDRTTGYAADFLETLQSISPALYLQPQLSVVTNAGGVNAQACAARAGEILQKAGSPELPIGVVTGDDLLDRIEELTLAGCEFEHFDTGQPLAELKRPIVAANAYLGALPITAAMRDGARLVITGRVADASLTVGPAMLKFGWNWNDFNRLAAATVAGHLLECGAQSTGGYSTNWAALNLGDVGYPIAEIDEAGATTLYKLSGTGGAVTQATVTEQLVYEIGDPRAYLTPDVSVDFTSLNVREIGRDRVKIEGAIGAAPPETYKVSLAYEDGFTASGQLLIYGKDCIEKAKACAAMIFDRVRRAGHTLAATHVELLGAGVGVPGLHEPPKDLREVMLRVSATSPKRAAIECFTKHFAPLITSGPAGIAGYTAGRPQVRPVFAYWPTRVPRAFVEDRIDVRTARDWASEIA